MIKCPSLLSGVQRSVGVVVINNVYVGVSFITVSMY